jgi:maltose O-acetyltransferase
MAWIEPLRALVQEHRLRAALRSRFPAARIERGVVLKGDVRNLHLEPGVVIQTGTVLHLGGMDWCQGKGQLAVGEDSLISPNCVLYGAGPGGVRIGRRFDCGPGVGIFASRTDYASGPRRHLFAPVDIGDDVIVYANCVIGPGVRVGDGAVIAAGAVVTDDVPAACLAAGAPARIVRRGIRAAGSGQ